MSDTNAPHGGESGQGGARPTAAGQRTATASPARDEESVLAKIVRIVFTPITWIVRPLVFRVNPDRTNPKVYFTSFSTLFFLWPIMVIGWIGPWISPSIIQPGVMGWAWITVLWIVILSIGCDMDRNKLIVLVLIIAILWLGGMLLEAKRGIPILSHIYEFFQRQNVTFEPGTVRVFGIITTVIMVLVAVGAWFDGRYEITTREITHRRILRTSDSIPRAAKRVKQDWRDVTEFVLGLGAGDVVVQDSNGNIVYRIANVPFLYFFRHDVDRILEVLATTEVAEVDAAMAENGA